MQNNENERHQNTLFVLMFYFDESFHINVFLIQVEGYISATQFSLFIFILSAIFSNIFAFCRL